MLLPGVLLVSLAGPVAATPGAIAAGHPQPMRQQSAGLSLEQAVEQVRAETGGRILSAETVTRNGRRVHLIKVLTPDHRVRVVHVDATPNRR